MTAAPFKASTFIKKRNALRSAIRSQGSPDILDAWDEFEGYTDCLTMDDAREARAQGREAGLRAVRARLCKEQPQSNTGMLRVVDAMIDTPTEGGE